MKFADVVRLSEEIVYRAHRNYSSLDIAGSVVLQPSDYDSLGQTGLEPQRATITREEHAGDVVDKLNIRMNKNIQLETLVPRSKAPHDKELLVAKVRNIDVPHHANFLDHVNLDRGHAFYTFSDGKSWDDTQPMDRLTTIQTSFIESSRPSFKVAQELLHELKTRAEDLHTVSCVTLTTYPSRPQVELAVNYCCRTEYVQVEMDQEPRKKTAARSVIVPLRNPELAPVVSSLDKLEEILGGALRGSLVEVAPSVRPLSELHHRAV